jgi:hypothetical protein
VKRLGLTVLTTLCVAMFCAPPARAENPDAALGTLEGLVGQWIALRERIADEKLEWDAQEERWREEIAVLEAEKARLSGEISEAREFTSSAAADRDRLATEQAAMRRAIEDITPALDRAEAVLRRWRDRLPPSLVAPLRRAFDELPAEHGAAHRTTVGRRLQRVVALYSQIEKLQYGIHVVREVIALPNTERREVDVLYVGLARGFAVSGDDRWAAVGTPANNGWTWSERPELAPTLRRAVCIAGNTAPAALVDLPLGLAPAAERGGSPQ